MKQFMGLTLKSSAPLSLNSNTQTISTSITNVGASASCDLREAAIPIKNQGQCGSCWAFSAVGILEYIYYINNKVYADLSEQKTSDCARTTASGCSGGWPEEAYKYYISYGLPKEASAPYKATNTYSFNSFSRAIDCYWANGAEVTTSTAGAPNNYKILSPNTEESMRDALHKYGWLSVCVNAIDWYGYSGGIKTENASTITDINHAVILCGYGEETVNGQNKKFWLIRNSWDTTWGEKGYIRIERDVGAFSIVQYADSTTYALSSNSKADFCEGKPY